MNSNWLEPEWPAPAAVRAISTTRRGGVSSGPWTSLNLGARGGDDAKAVERNRALLVQALPASPCWLHQVHGTTVIDHPGSAGASDGEPPADGIVSFAAGEVCAVLAADCLSVLFCDRGGTRVAAAHAGWRGLAAGVLQAAVAAMRCPPAEVLAWLGPAIGPSRYEVGDDVAGAFPDELDKAFTRRGDRWLLDLYAAARLKLASAGVTAVYGGSYCTWSDAERFYSFRRDGVTGRMASLIWLQA